jgi:hypothetical protein
MVAAMVTVPPRQIGRFMPEALTLGFPGEQGRVVQFAPDADVPPGARLFSKRRSPKRLPPGPEAEARWRSGHRSAPGALLPSAGGL